MVKNLPANAEDTQDLGWSLGQVDPLEEEIAVTHSNTLAWKNHGQRSLVGYCPWGSKKLNTTKNSHTALLILWDIFLISCFPTYARCPCLLQFLRKGDSTFSVIAAVEAGHTGVSFKWSLTGPFLSSFQRILGLSSLSKSLQTLHISCFALPFFPRVFFWVQNMNLLYALPLLV